MVNNLKTQDLQLTNIDLYDQFKLFFNNKEYEQALSLLKNISVENQIVNANVINTTAENVITLENTDDPNFKKNKIITSEIEPPSLLSGEVWFNIVQEVI